MKYANAKLDQRLMEVVELSTYLQNPDIYPIGRTAIPTTINGVDYVFPVRNVTDTRPGYCTRGCNCVAFLRTPDEIPDEYLSKNAVVDFSDSKTIQDIVEKQNECKQYEREMLCNADNIYRPPLLNTDTPAMRGLKDSMIAKNFDLDKYQDRFGVNYPNDKRQMNKDDITLKMLRRMAINTDIEVTMTFRDKNSDVPNPMNREITVNITGDASTEDKE
jgi:hypothetical protein